MAIGYLHLLDLGAVHLLDLGDVHLLDLLKSESSQLVTCPPA